VEEFDLHIISEIQSVFLGNKVISPGNLNKIPEEEETDGDED
jgi:hypothetical protein